jgi:hypothetical protein
MLVHVTSMPKDRGGPSFQPQVHHGDVVREIKHAKRLPALLLVVTLPLTAACTKTVLMPGSGAIPAPTTTVRVSFGLPPTTEAPPPTSPVGLASTRCTTSQLTLTPDAPVSEPTGQHSLLLDLINHSTTPCYLSGYPGISLYDSLGNLLPLAYVRHGDQVVTSDSPERVDLGSGIAAYIMINKYRCDSGTKQEAASLRLIPPNDTSFLTLSLNALMELGYCGPGDPGSTLEISPVEPTASATRWTP